MFIYDITMAMAYFLNESHSLFKNTFSCVYYW